MSGHTNSLAYRINRSAMLTVSGVLLFFSLAIGITVVAPRYVDPSWTQPSSEYQMQMYEVFDPHLYISAYSPGLRELQHVYHIQQGYSLLSFQESSLLRIVAPQPLEKYITRLGSTKLLLTSKLLFLREPEDHSGNVNDPYRFNAIVAANNLQSLYEQQNQTQAKEKLNIQVMELYCPDKEQGFSRVNSDGIMENWVDENFEIISTEASAWYLCAKGVGYIKNPLEYRIDKTQIAGKQMWEYSPKGEQIFSVQQLTSQELGFISRKDLISMGEKIYAAEGCWYCHTDQTRTLVQDCVLNGSESFPAPPSSANEYIYQKITFPGTRRIGPDLSRVGVKRPSRDWHKSHFWSPKTESPGSIMPRFRHFFDDDPRGTSRHSQVGVPNHKFEAVFQYLMTKGTRITPPNRAWWLGQDPVKTKEIIEGKSRSGSIL